MCVCVCVCVRMCCVDPGIKATMVGLCAFGCLAQSVELSLVKSRSNTNIVSECDVRRIARKHSIARPQSATERTVDNLHKQVDLDY